MLRQRAEQVVDDPAGAGLDLGADAHAGGEADVDAVDVELVAIDADAALKDEAELVRMVQWRCGVERLRTRSMNRTL